MQGSAQVQPATAASTASASRDGSSRFSSSRLMSFIPTTAPSLALEGKYSIERLLAVDEYSRTRSMRHVLWVLARTPAFPAFMIIAYELPPLAPPEAGWQANWVFFFVRLGIGMVLATECLLAIPRLIMPELDRALTVRTRAWIALVASLIYIGFCATLAQVWGFPVPFTITIANPPLGTLVLIMVYVAARPVINQSDALQRRFFYCCCYVCTMPLMSLVYPAYMALFLAVGKHHPSNQPLVTLLVPLIKLSIRKLIATIAADCEDLIPVIIVFSIELYNALFQVICVQVGSSQVTIAVIMAIDVAISMSGIYRLNELTKTLQQLLNASNIDSLLPTISEMCETQLSPTPDNRVLSSIRLHSALEQCGLSEEGKGRLESMGKTDVFSSATLPGLSVDARPDFDAVQPVGRSLRARALATKIAPSTTVTEPIKRQGSTPVRMPSSRVFPQENHSMAILETTSLLFRSEYLLLGEYLECVIPWLYAVNLVLLWLSPNGAYYPHTRALVTNHELFASLLNVGIFFLLEAVSFVALSVILWKRLRFSPLHQLSYVLENQVHAVHAQMILILIMSLHFNLDHAGADFSFQFQWLKKAPPTK